MTLPTSVLKALVNKLQSIVSAKPSIPVIGNFLINASNDEVTITATDMMVTMECQAPARVLQEGSITLPAKRFAQLVKELIAPEVEISSHAQDIATIVCGASRFKLNGMPAEEFPPTHNLESSCSFTITGSLFKKMLSQTAFSVARDDTRHALTGILLSLHENALVCTGTDGRRMARTRAELTVDPSLQAQAILPIKAVDEIIKNFSDDELITLFCMPERIAVKGEYTLLISKLLHGEYPDTHRLIPEHTPISLAIHREELFALLRQISLFINPSQAVRFHFEENSLSLFAQSMDIGEGDVRMIVDYHGPCFEIAFHPGFVIDALKHCSEENVLMSLSDPFNPCLITDGETPFSRDAPLVCLVMPMACSPKR